MFRSAQLGAFWKILSQVNIEEIREEVERPFHVLIAGEPVDLADRLACLLSHDTGGFQHPWLTVASLSDVAGVDQAGRADMVILVVQASAWTSGGTSHQHALLKAEAPMLVVVTGAPSQQAGVHLARSGTGTRVDVAELTPDAVQETIGPALVAQAPDWLRLALGRRLPPLRHAVYDWLIKETSQANAAYSFSTGLAETIPVLDIPLNVGDLFVLTKNQLIMAYQLALVAGKESAPQKLIGEIMSVLGGGFIFRQLARQLIGVVPVWGLVPKVAIAYAGTWTIGHAVVLWAEDGQRVTPELLKQFYAEALEKGQRAAQEIVGNVSRRLGKEEEKTDPAEAESEKRPWKRLWRSLPGRRTKE